MAKRVIQDGRVFVQPRWQDEDRFAFTKINDDKRERRDTNKIVLATMYLFDR